MEWSKRWFVLLAAMAFVDAALMQVACAGVDVPVLDSEAHAGDVAMGAGDAKDERSDGTTASDDFEDNLREITILQEEYLDRILICILSVLFPELNKRRQ